MSEKKWNLENSDSGIRSALKRNAGVMMGNNVQAMEAFYQVVSFPPKSLIREEQWFACLCMECLWKTEDHPRIVKMEQLLRELYLNQETSNSIRDRVLALLDMPWNEDGFLLGKLCGFAKMLRAKDGTVMPDFDALADDLALWNHPDRPVQRRWIRTICSPGKDGNNKNNGNNENEMEDEENVD